jgi:hypothetical protein
MKHPYVLTALLPAPLAALHAADLFASPTALVAIEQRNGRLL